MADDLYDDGPATSSPKAKAKDDGAETALLPTDFFPETPEVGKVCKVRVTRVLDGQAEVEYVHEEKNESEPEAEMEMADAELEGLMS